MSEAGEPVSLAAAWQDVPVAMQRVPLIGPEAFVARLAAGQFGEDFPLLDMHHPPNVAERDSAFLDRPAVADALAAGNASLDNPLDDATVAALRTDGVMVVAGQQPGLLLGPMFTLLKAITAINAADRLRQVLDVPVLPAFWIASEDHDLEEVNRCTAGERKLVLDHPPLHRPGARPPVGQVPLQEHRAEIEAFVEAVAADLPHGDLFRELTAGLDLHSYATQFGKMLGRLMRQGGRGDAAPLVLIDPAWLRRQTAPVLAAAAERWPAVEAALEQGRRHLADRRVTAPLDRVDIFRLNQWDGREPTSITADTPRLIEREPDRFSPSAALRPIVQDAMLPTVATVAGPTELQYLWQIDPLYEALAVDRSHLLPRLSATLIDGATRRRFRRLTVDRSNDAADPAAILDVLDRIDHLHAAPPRTDDADFERVEALGRELIDRLAAIDDPAERRTLDKAIGSIRYRIDRVTRRLRQRRLDRHGVGLRNLERIAALVYPRRQLQERGSGALEMIGRFGPDLIDALRRLDPAPTRHHLLWADGPPAGTRSANHTKDPDG